MAVSNVTVKQKYAGDDVTTSFPIPFAFVTGDLTVIKVAVYDDATKTEILPTPTYNLSPGGDSPTAVVFTVAPETGQTVLVFRQLPLTQVVDYIQNGAFLAESHETGLDRIVMMIQQLADTTGRAIQLNLLDDGVVNPVLPPGVASAVIGFNADVDGLQIFPPGDFIGPAGEINNVQVVGELEYDDPTPMSVQNVGSATNADLRFTLRIGRAATIAVGTVDTVLPTDPATVTNVGTASDAIFNFEIPKGEKGEKGESTVLVTAEPFGPNDAIGSDGDIWIDTGFSPATKGNLYQKISGTYIYKTNIMGPAGGVNSFNTRQGDVVSQASDYTADQIDYDNLASGLTAVEVQAAVDELKALIDGLDPIPSQTGNAGKVLKTDGTEASWESIDAAEIAYDNVTSGLTATDVQDAIDEVNDKVDNLDPLPDQTGNAGKFLKTDGTDASWDDVDVGIAVSALQTLDDTDEIVLVANKRFQRVKIKASASGIVRVTLPNGTSDGDLVYVLGYSNSDVCVIENSGNVSSNGDVEFSLGVQVAYLWDTGNSKWYQVGGY